MQSAWLVQQRPAAALQQETEPVKMSLLSRKAVKLDSKAK